MRGHRPSRLVSVSGGLAVTDGDDGKNCDQERDLAHPSSPGKGTIIHAPERGINCVCLARVARHGPERSATGPDHLL